MSFDYSLYLVTDSTQEILGDKDLIEVVTQALEGGVTVVQYRDKNSSSRELQETADKLHQVTKAYGVPLIINDRVDIVLAVGAEGVHLGQDDMDLATARTILGPKAIIGVTCATSEEAGLAAAGGADYLGIGTVFPTATKTDTKQIIGTTGVREILTYLSSISSQGKKVATVAIGGINSSNAQRVKFQSQAGFQTLDGVAVVSAIMAATDPMDAARKLMSLLGQQPAFAAGIEPRGNDKSIASILAKVPEVVRRVTEIGPLSHNMINQVVINFAANVALAIGARPIMSQVGDEAEDLARLGGCLIINMGTVQPQTVENYLQALRAYNAAGGPVLFDPVGAGATSLRRETIKRLMAGGYFDVIKGNESEIRVVFGDNGGQQRGVDSGDSAATHEEKANLTAKLARRERNVVIMTGKTDYLSDGDRTFAVSNGHRYLGQVTGTGCTLGTVTASFLAVEREDRLLAALSSLLMFEIAAEIASERPTVLGPGTFVPAFIDSLANIALRSKDKETTWVGRAKVESLPI